MNRNHVLMSALILPACFAVTSASAQDSLADDVMSISALRAQALRALKSGDNDTAILAADAMMREHPKDARSMRLAGDIYLRTGKVKDAVRLFDRYVESEPEKLPELWQRGIALYFVGDYKRAAKQFEEHREVNPHDVENAAWHFLCFAKSESVETAKRMVLPAPDDPRVPMKEVLQMLSSGNTEAVAQRVDELSVDTAARAEAEFYGFFYLGLYADAGGESEGSSVFSRAAKNAPHHYMGDIARVYAKHLENNANDG